ncbi:MAG: hypothetical protein KUG53_00270 [Pseudomonadales bacterium]|nr:hypothetical protein [Pseudomonadales bacterium]
MLTVLFTAWFFFAGAGLTAVNSGNDLSVAHPPLILVPVFSGKLVSGANSELLVLANGTLKEPWGLSIKMGQQTNRIILPAGTTSPAVFSIPFRVADGNKLTVEFRSRSGIQFVKQVSLSIAENQYPAITREISVLPEHSSTALHFGPGNSAIRIQPNQLPFYSGSYQNLSALWIAASQLAQLNDHQINALALFVADCGQVTLLNSSPLIDQWFEQHAGCNHSNLQFEPSRQPTGEMHPHAIAPKLPGWSSLSRISETGSAAEAAYRSILLLIIFTVSVLVFAIRRNILAIAIATGSVLIIQYLSYQQTATSSYFTSWLEMTNGAHHARYVSQLELNNYSGSPATINFPAPLISFDLLNIPEDSHIDHYVVSPTHSSIEVSTSLFSTARLGFAGTVAVDPMLQISPNGGSFQVINNSAEKSPAGYFAIQDNLYQLPALDSGERWKPQIPLSSNKKTSFIKLWQSRAHRYSASILMPFGLSKAGVPVSVQETGWLLIGFDKAS